jgi:hypothetical protein
MASAGHNSRAGKDVKVLGRLRLAASRGAGRGLAEAPPQQRTLGVQAASHAAASVLLFEGIGDLVGLNRARCMLVRSLVAADRLISATRTARRVGRWLVQQDSGQPMYLPLRARFLRAKGELELAYGEYRSAQNSLAEAADGFEKLGDWANRDEVWAVLHLVRRGSPGAADEGILRDDHDEPWSRL